MFAVFGCPSAHFSTACEHSTTPVEMPEMVIAGVPDPRVYGSSGAYGSDKDSVTDPLERSAVDSAVKGTAKSMQFDIFGTHEPVAAAQLRKDLPNQIRQTNAGHTHAQNRAGEQLVGRCRSRAVDVGELDDEVVNGG